MIVRPSPSNPAASSSHGVSVEARCGRPTAMRPSERISAAALLVLAALAAVGARRADLVLLYVVLCVATLVLARLPPSATGTFVRDWFPVVLVVLAYLTLQPVISGVNARRWDAALSALDERWFHGIVEAWREAFGRPGALTDASYAFYLSYYLLPLAGAALARRWEASGGERTVFAILLSFWASYAGYFLLPAEGPRLPLAEEAGLGGGAISVAARAFLRHAELTRLDAFPSGHTSVSLVAAALAFRVAPRARWAFPAWAVGIVFSTVYVHVHYLVDVLAGALLAAAVLLCADPLRRRLGGPAPSGEDPAAPRR